MTDDMIKYLLIGLVVGIAIGFIVWLLVYACKSLLHILQIMF